MQSRIVIGNLQEAVDHVQDTAILQIDGGSWPIARTYDPGRLNVGGDIFDYTCNALPHCEPYHSKPNTTHRSRRARGPALVEMSFLQTPALSPTGGARSDCLQTRRVRTICTRKSLLLLSTTYRHTCRWKSCQARFIYRGYDNCRPKYMSGSS